MLRLGCVEATPWVPPLDVLNMAMRQRTGSLRFGQDVAERGVACVRSTAICEPPEPHALTESAVPSHVGLLCPFRNHAVGAIIRSCEVQKILIGRALA